MKALLLVTSSLPVEALAGDDIKEREEKGSK